jgi:DNA-binding PadR family transcriptional regulator
MVDVMAKIARYYDIIRNAEIANSFIILQVLSDAKDPLSSSQISETIAVRSNGKIYKIPSTMKSSLETLRTAGLVNGKDFESKNERKPVRMTLYTITEKGKDLAKAWRGFLSALE